MTLSTEFPDRHAQAARSTWVSVVVNAVLSTAQIVIGVFAHSQSLVSDGFHSLSDLIADFVVLAANKVSRNAADTDHPYGHARFETVASLILGLLLVFAACAMLWVAGSKFLTPEDIPTVHIFALYAAAVTLIAKECLFRYMLAVARRVGSSMLVANAWHARADALSSLVVLLGIGGNLLGFTFLDPLAAAVVGLMIARTGGKFMWNALNRLADSGLSREETEKIRATLRQTSGVTGVHDLRTRYMGDDVAIDVHLIVAPRSSASEAHLIGIAAAERLKRVGATLNHRVLEVLVHIDTEDDAGKEASFVALPSRDEITSALPRAMKPITDTSDHGASQKNPLFPEMMIFYSNDRVEMDWIFETMLTPEHTALIDAAIASLQNQYPAVAKVRVLGVIGKAVEMKR